MCAKKPLLHHVCSPDISLERRQYLPSAASFFLLVYSSFSSSASVSSSSSAFFYSSNHLHAIRIPLLCLPCFFSCTFPSHLVVSSSSLSSSSSAFFSSSRFLPHFHAIRIPLPRLPPPIFLVLFFLFLLLHFFLLVHLPRLVPSGWSHNGVCWLPSEPRRPGKMFYVYVL